MVTGYEFVNTATGEVLRLSTTEARVNRMRKRIAAWSRSLPRGYQYILVTLTYRAVNGWSARHVSAFLKRVRRHLGDALVGYAWVAELQRRGAVHYHVVLVVTPGARIPKPDEAGWWPHGSSRVELVRRARAGASYLRKYISKAECVDAFPAGLRLFAVVIRRAFSDAAWSLRWLSAPAWLRAAVSERCIVVGVGVAIRRVCGGFEVGGIFVASPWRFVRLLRESFA